MRYQLQRQFVWPDRRPITALHVADAAIPFSSTNPARWLFDPSIDVTTPSGLADFATRMDAYIDGAILVMREINAQGMVVWEIDGCRPSTQTYLGAPDYAERLNPELSYGVPRIIYNFFTRFRYAGFKVGCLLRPTEFNLTTQLHEVPADYFESLRRKAFYAKYTWGCRLFYVDTNMENNGNYVLDAHGFNIDPPLLRSTIFARLHQAFPDCLFIPEHEDIPYNLWTAPYRELRGGETGTPENVRAEISDAFSVLFCSGGDIAGNMAALRESRNRGDIMMLNGWWRNPAEIDDFRAIYA